MKADKILQMIPNMVPLRAVFHNYNTNSGMDVPVVGFALLETVLEDKELGNDLIGIAICEDGLDICESYSNFAGYAEPVKIDVKTGKVLENNPEDVHSIWARKHGIDLNENKNETEITEAGMGLVRTALDNDNSELQTTGSEPGVVATDDRGRNATSE